MASAAIKAHFLSSQIWFAVKEILLLFRPNRERGDMVLSPGKARVLEFEPTKSRAFQFQGRGQARS